MTTPATPADPPPALATTKRKFHKLLDNLTASTSATPLTMYSSPNASTSSLPRTGSPEPLAKRPRSSEAANSSIERARQISAGQARIQALKDQLLSPKPSSSVTVERKKTLRVVPKASFNDLKDGATQGQEARKPNFQPYSQSAFLERLQTFTVKKWSTKPDPISEVAWAKRGWSYDIYHIPIASRARSNADLLSRYSFLLAISADLPLAKNATHPGPPISSIISRLPLSFFASAGQTAPATEEERTAFAFALFGWTGVVESRISLAVCNHCFQRLGLWMSSDARLQEMSKRLDVSVESLRLNLLESHREHCPWKNGVVQGNPADSPIAGMPAWETLVFMLVGKGNRMSLREGAEKELPKLPQESAHEGRAPHDRMESVDLGSETTYPRGSMESSREVVGYNDEGDEETITNKWKKFKAKLKRSTSKRSLKSVKSYKSVMSAKSVKSTKSGKSGKENDVEDD
ncbi:hypothetical protein E8E11_007267 [Didymella keratinophila]|nr:hypothetical protein E8E11_007267 [Didymella keratinophila]